MAVDEQHVKCGTIYEDEIILEVMNTGLKYDGFKADKCLTRVIQNKNKQFLVVDAGCLRFEERNKRESRKEECLFEICCYQNSDMSAGLPVILSVCDGGENRIICCYDDGNEKCVYAKLQDLPLPGYIEESNHEAIFFLQSVKEQRNCYRFKSSLWPKWFLTSEEGDDLVKLVLRKAGEDVVEGLHLLKP
ncbi:interleukin-18-like isoform X1 [Anguilla rostrata]|uniref:Interleukin-18 n=1 Tax=Anguilla anguilla TaxID=7936 RepID=A0A0E9X4F4_ANGAN